MKRFFILAFLLFFAISFNVPIVKAQVNPGSVLLILFKGAEFLISDKPDSKGANSNPNEKLTPEVKKAVEDDFEKMYKKKLVLQDPYPPIKVDNNDWALRYNAEVSKGGIIEHNVWFVCLIYDEQKKHYNVRCSGMPREKYERFIKLPEEEQKDIIKKQFMKKVS